MSESNENSKSEPKKKKKSIAPDGVSQYQKFRAVEISRTEITGAEYNPRKMSPSNKRKLRKALADPKIGLLTTIVWNKRTGNVVGGHQRLEQLDALEGRDDYKLTVAAVDMDEQQEKMANVVLNNPGLQGEYDMPVLEDIMAELHEADINIERTGFTPADIQFLFSDELVASVFGGDQEEQFEDQDEDIDTLNQIFEDGADDRREEREVKKIEKEIEAQAEAELAAEVQESGMSEEEKEALKIEKLKELRQKYKEQANSGENSADIMLTLVFGGTNQVDAFLRHFKQPMDAKIVDAYPIMEQIGIEYQEHA